MGYTVHISESLNIDSLASVIPYDHNKTKQTNTK